MRKPKSSGTKTAGPVKTTMGNPMRIKGRKSGRAKSRGRC